MISRNGSTARGTEITIRLRSVRELFERLPIAAMTSEPLRLQSGIDELVNELGASRLRNVTGAAIELPASELRPGVEEWVRWMIVSYCELELRKTANDLRAFRRDAYRALVIGMFLFVAGLTASTLINTSSDPQIIKTFFGDGLAVVIAWIGAWYPLDTLLNYTRPYLQARRVLQALSGLNIVVRAAP